MQLQEAGISAVLEKPVNPSTMLDLINAEGGGHVRLPVAPEPPEVLAGLDQLAGARVLLAEDNDINQQIANELLSRLGIEVVTVENGHEAVELLGREEGFDVVLMDLQMPVMDGYEATRTIRRDERWRGLPIVAMTAHAMSSERERCLAAGMNDHVTKPIDVDALHAALLRWIKPHRRRAPVPVPVSLTDPGDDGGLPETLPGIDLPYGLRLLGENRGLYAQLARSFAWHHRDAAKRLGEALREGRIKEAATLAHSLKGTAGNLGARRFSQAAGALEQMLSEGIEVTGVPAEFEESLEELMGGLIPLLEAPEEGDEGAVEESLEGRREEVLPRLERFVEMVESDLAEAHGLYREIADGLAHTPLRDASLRLGELLADYDTDAALALAGQMIERLAERR